MPKRKRKASKARKATAKRPTTRAPIDPAVALVKEWPQLSPLQRGERLKTLVVTGRSRHALARAIGKSEGLIRQLLLLTELPEEEKGALVAGNLSCKKAAARARQIKAAQLKQSSTASGVPIREQVQAGAQLIEEFFRAEVPDYCWSQLLAEIEAAPYNFRREEFRREAPRPWQIPRGKDPREIILDCRPSGEKPTYGPDLMNYWFTWFARWSQRAIANSAIREAASATARRRLLGC